MENPENTLMELNGFEKSPKPTIPKNLEDYLLFIAKTGNTVFPWPKIKPLMKMKLEVIITEFHESLPAEQSIPKMPNVDPFKYTEMKERIFEQLDSYSGVPFTVQRLCELLTQPKRHYKRVDKFMRGLEKVMLVVSTVDPLPVGGGGETMTNHNGDLGGASSRQDTHTGESPLKRMRLSTSEDEESGPCDSRDGIQGSVNSDSQDKVDSNEAGPSGCNLEPVAAPLATPENGVVEEMESDMDIDTECTSSEARLALPPVSQTGEEEGSTWIGSKQVCDSGVVTTSEASDKIEGEAENEGVSDSTEGVKVIVEEDVDNCSSSDQDDIRVGGGGLDNQEEDSEAEPTEDSREVVDEVGGSIAEDSGVVSVQSSEERGEETDSSLSEPGGAADSSDDISLVPPVVDSQDQPSCSTAPVDNVSDNINTEEETSGEVSSAAEANIVEDKKEENNVEVSPDQSDDTVQ